MVEKQIIEQALQTSCKITIVRGGKAPKVEVRVGSICNMGDEDEMIKLLIKTQKDVYEELKKGDLEHGTEETH